MDDDTRRINRIIAELGDGFLKDHGFTIFNIHIRSVAKGLVLSGECLTDKQLALLKKSVRSLSLTQKAIFDVNVLTGGGLVNRSDKWGKAGKSLVNVTNDMAGSKLTTQITQNDNYFRIIAQQDGMALVQLEDRTLGWVNGGDISIHNMDLSERRSGLRLAERGKTLTVSSIEPLFCEASKYVNKVKYLHGGKSTGGMDCSAFVQTVFKDACKIIMPRHTLDQMRCGIRVPKKSIGSGDLIFAKVKGRRIMHVGIALFENDGMIFHSCLREKLVIRENIDDFFKHYTFAGAARIVEKAP